MSKIPVKALVSREESTLGMSDQVHTRLDLAADTAATARELTSRIQLCDVLLVEISAIRNELANDIKQARGSQLLAGRHV